MSTLASFGAARRATTADLTELQRLETLAATLTAPQRGGDLFLHGDARTSPLTTLLDADDALVLVGTIDDVVVGHAAVQVVTLVDGRLVAQVDDLFVEPDARQVGVGEALMNTILEWASEHDCIGVDATALPGDRHTKNFFESFGLVARAISVHRSIS